MKTYKKTKGEICLQFVVEDDDMIYPDNDPHYESRCSDPTFAAIVPLCVTLASVHHCAVL